LRSAIRSHLAVNAPGCAECSRRGRRFEGLKSTVGAALRVATSSEAFFARHLEGRFCRDFRTFEARRL
jgi:hypothetical protein